MFASDVQADPKLSLDQRAAYTAIQIGAYIGILLIKEGEFVAGLAVHNERWSFHSKRLTASERLIVAVFGQDSANTIEQKIKVNGFTNEVICTEFKSFY